MGYSYMYEEDVFLGLLSGLLTSIPTMVFGIATYVLSSLAIYTIAKRRGLNKPWLAWIPVVNCWLLGSLSDQYRYVVKDENKSKRKSLLILSILTMVLSLTICVLSVVIMVQAISGATSGVSDAYLLETIMGPLVGVLGLCLPLIGIAIAYAIIYYMALYDVYKSLDPSNCVLFLVLSILFSVTEPFFLFFNRNKDLGMPPRKEEPAYIPEQPQWVPQEPAQEPWEMDNKDYL